MSSFPLITGTILTYGQTGSGKSFSMFGAGDLVSGPLRGIVPVQLYSSVIIHFLDFFFVVATIGSSNRTRMLLSCWLSFEGLNANFIELIFIFVRMRMCCFYQRSANALFAAIRQATDCEEVTIKLSFLEIYNEVVYEFFCYSCASSYSGCSYASNTDCSTNVLFLIGLLQSRFAESKQHEVAHS